MAILTHTQPGCYLYVQCIPGTCITCVHVTGTFYKGHLATKLFVHIRQMLWKFHIVLGHLYRPQVFFCQMFWTSPGHVLVCTCQWHISFWRFSWQVICAHPTGAPAIAHFSQVIYQGCFFRFSAHPRDMYCLFTCV